jgi:hypothetical protein
MQYLLLYAIARQDRAPYRVLRISLRSSVYTIRAQRFSLPQDVPVPYSSFCDDSDAVAFSERVPVDPDAVLGMEGEDAPRYTELNIARTLRTLARFETTASTPKLLRLFWLSLPWGLSENASQPTEET